MLSIKGKGIVLKLDQPFEVDGVRYAASWLRYSTKKERDALGIVETPDAPTFDTRFYWSENNPKRLEDEEVTVWENIVIETDGVSGIASTSRTHTETGLKTQWKKQQDQTAYTLLSPNDWYITRNAETGAAIPVGITSFRTEVRSVCAERQDMIVATTSVPQLASLVTGAGTSSIVGYTTTMLPNWPDLSDYT